MSGSGVHPARVDARPLRVLIHRVGSLGDTLVALPALRLVAAAYPNAQRILLGNVPVSSVAQPAAAVLEGLGLIHGEARYAARSGLRGLLEVLRATRRARPDVVVSLSSKPGAVAALRDWLFFKLAGAREVIGLGLTDRALRTTGDGSEREAQRLARLLGKLGRVDWDDAGAWRYPVSQQQIDSLEQAAPGWRWQPDYICLALGTKVPANDWGHDRWAGLLAELARSHPQLRLACIGAAEDAARSQALLDLWPGDSINLCGRLALPQTAALLSRARALVCHDSGPMHLAAAVGTPVVAVFSRRNPMGKWFPLGFPQGRGHATMYSSVDCAGCGLTVCARGDNLCLAQIGADAVAGEVRRRLAG